MQNPGLLGHRAAIVLLIASTLALAGPAAAQSAGQIAEDRYAPPVIREVPGGIELPDTQGSEPPPGSETVSVVPSGLAVEGGFPDMAEDTDAIARELEGKRVTGAELFRAARSLEAAYARAGYILARVSLPQQVIRDGQPLRLIVTDGYIADIDASALPGPARRRVTALLDPLLGRRRLTRRQIERQLLLASDTPGVLLRSALHPGQEPGSTLLMLSGRYAPMTAHISGANGLDEALGGFSASAGAEFNNLLGRGEVAYLRLAGYPDPGGSFFGEAPRNRQLIAGITVPLGTIGAWATVEGIDSRTNPRNDDGFAIAAEFRRLSGELGYHWLRSRDANVSSRLALVASDETQTIAFFGLALPFSEDRMRVVRLTQNADFHEDSGGDWKVVGVFSTGLNAFGARHGTEALPLSRLEAKPDFHKLELTVHYDGPVQGSPLRLAISATGQTSFGETMVSSQQFGIGGPGWLSAFGSGALQGDAGLAGRVELSRPDLLARLKAGDPGHGDFLFGWAPYAFSAAGVIRLENPSGLETRNQRAAALGAGTRLTFARGGGFAGGHLSVEYAHGFSPDRGLDDADRINLQLSFRF